MTEETSNKTDRPPARGFTLIEVLVASVLFAIGMLAAMAMQYTALGGFGNSRDVTNAAKVGDRVLNMMRAESQQWSSGTRPSGTTAVYDDSNDQNTYFNDPMIDGLTWDWSAVFASPVDVRLTDAGPRRYCAYARGGEMSGADGIMQVQIAVVYPGPNGVFPDNDCQPQGGPDITGNLDPSSSPPALEVETGFRAVYTGGIINRRDYLDFFRS
jgi:prepilin-type N-terminal cleavage/methylation domain-containing protein